MIEKILSDKRLQKILKELSNKGSVKMNLTDAMGNIVLEFSTDQNSVPDLNKTEKDVSSRQKGGGSHKNGNVLPRLIDTDEISMPLYCKGILAGFLVALVASSAKNASQRSHLVQMYHMAAKFIELHLEMINGTEVLNNRLRKALDTDPLTGLGNYRACRLSLEAQVVEANKELQPFSVAMLSLDYFNALNDTHGVKTGDAYLIAAAMQLLDSIEPTDMLFRDKGARFVVVMPKKRQRDASAKAEMLKECLESIQLKILPEWHLMVNVGAASWKFGMTSVDEILEAVDVALFKSRRQRTRMRSLEAFSRSFTNYDNYPSSLDSINT